jgi:hypothetical protein
VCGNTWSAATFFPRWLEPVAHVEDADFEIAIATFFCEPRPGSRRLREVRRDGALLSYVDELRPVRGVPLDAREQAMRSRTPASPASQRNALR